MALSYQLEQYQTCIIEAHQTLIETLLVTLTRVASQQELSEAWTRIAAHFDALFITEHSVDRLKQTILELAVMGRLVPQDPNDEPASALLARIVDQKGHLMDNGEIKKQKPLPATDEETWPFALPKGWQWCRLQEVAYLLGDGLHGTPEYTPNERYYYVNGNNLSDGKIVFKPDAKTVAQDQYE
jgi:type I restriction enzyme S subunit